MKAILTTECGCSRMIDVHDVQSVLHLPRQPCSGRSKTWTDEIDTRTMPMFQVRVFKHLSTKIIEGEKFLYYHEV
jgi:hypothetical protein